MRAVVCGANGAMGKLLCGILGDEAVGKVSLDGENGVPKTFEELGDVQADVVIDFSHHTAVGALMDFCIGRNLPVVVATTGQTAEEKEVIAEAARKIPVFFSANMSIGVALVAELAKKLEEKGKEMNLSIRLQREDIFEAMHRV